MLNCCCIASAPERVNSAVHPKQGSRSNMRGERQGGERLDNRPDRQDRQGGEDRFPSRGGPRGLGGRQRLGSKENDRVSVFGVVCLEPLDMVTMVEHQLLDT